MANNAPREEVIEPLYWMQAPETENVYAINTEIERGNLEAVGYSITTKPKQKNVTPPPPAPAS